jgi:hypothetical protein
MNAGSVLFHFHVFQPAAWPKKKKN